MKSSLVVLGMVLAVALSVALPLSAVGMVASDGGGASSRVPFSAQVVSQPSVLTSSSAIPQVNGWFRTSVNATVSAITSVTVVKNGTTTLTAEVATSYPFVVNDPGTTTIRHWSYNDGASGAVTETIKIDGTPPVTAVVTTPTVAAPDSWSSGTVTVNLIPSDALSGVDTTFYQINAGVISTYTAPFAVTDEGITTVKFQSTDLAGNLEASKTATVRIDRVAPAAPAQLTYSSRTDTTVRLTWPAATDALSGVAHYELRDGATLVGSTTELAYLMTGLVPSSNHTFSVVAVDKAGNSSAPTQLVVTTASSIASQYVSAGSSKVATMSLSGGGAAVVTFPMVSAAGTVTVSTLSGPPAAAPIGMRFLGQYWDVSFAGSFSGTATVTLPYPAGIPSGRAADLSILHWVNGAWVSAPTTVNTADHTITVQLTSLGQLALAEPITASVFAKITPRFIRFYPAYDTSSSVTAWLRDASGEGLNGYTLLLQRKEGLIWTTYSTMKWVGDGTYRGYVKPINFGRTTVRIMLAENPYIYTAVSPQMTLIPEVWLSTPKPSVTSIARYRRFSVTGSMLPAHAGTGTFSVTKWNGSHYITISKYTKSIAFSSTGKFKTYLSLPKGTYRFYSGEGKDSYTADHGKSRSGRSAKVTVR